MSLSLSDSILLLKEYGLWKNKFSPQLWQIILTKYSPSFPDSGLTLNSSSAQDGQWRLKFSWESSGHKILFFEAELIKCLRDRKQLFSSFILSLKEIIQELSIT